MPKKQYNAEEIIHKLRGADVLLSQGKASAKPASRSASATRPTIAGAKPMVGRRDRPEFSLISAHRLHPNGPIRPLS